jgi:hypothetical protein
LSKAIRLNSQSWAGQKKFGGMYQGLQSGLAELLRVSNLLDIQERQLGQLTVETLQAESFYAEFLSMLDTFFCLF